MVAKRISGAENSREIRPRALIKNYKRGPDIYGGKCRVCIFPGTDLWQPERFRQQTRKLVEAVGIVALRIAGDERQTQTDSSRPAGIVLDLRRHIRFRRVRIAVRREARHG